ncbi:uncharacterized protein LOC131215792 [Anopheles bellator]|uniref:uncharacterized protein LOC131215792 n=1 Tax=Anopheles bellator TaxID=139047 RepID=UPI002647D52E|nr:uncharacterized protein LOC131215792 [Anopheles bellator]
MKHNGYPGTLTMDLNRLLKVFPGIALTWVCFLVAVCCVRLTEARIGYFWHITDLHLDTYYTTKGDIFRSCWLTEHHSNTANAKRPGPYGDYMCDSPWSLLESATQAMKSKQGDNVEFVLWTGDGLSHSAKRMHDSKRLDVLRNITELMSRTFPSQFVFPVLGHEDGSANFEQLGDLWRHWLPLEALQTFEKGGYYTIEQTKSRLRIIALNTNYMRHDPKYSQSHSSAVKQRPDGSYHYPAGGHYSDHHGIGKHYHGRDGSASSGYLYSDRRSGYGSSSNVADGGLVGHASALSGSSSHESEKQWEWLEEVLAKSSRNKETVYIVGHIPPGSDERHIGHMMPFGHSSFTEKNNARYLRLVKRYSSIIQGQFFGHLHSDSFRVVYNEVGSFNGRRTQPCAGYYRANSVRHATGTCEGVCLLNHYCAITRLDYRDFQICLETAAKALASKNGAPTGPATGRLLLAVGPALLILLLTCCLPVDRTPHRTLVDTLINFISCASSIASAVAVAALAATSKALAVPLGSVLICLLALRPGTITGHHSQRATVEASGESGSPTRTV